MTTENKPTTISDEFDNEDLDELLRDHVRLSIDRMDDPGGFGQISYHIVDGGQTVASVDEGCFDNPSEAKRWANRLITINSALPTLVRMAKELQRTRAVILEEWNKWQERGAECAEKECGPADEISGALDAIANILERLDFVTPSDEP